MNPSLYKLIYVVLIKERVNSSFGNVTREFQMSMFIRNEPFESTKEAIIISADLLNEGSRRRRVIIKSTKLQLNDLKTGRSSWET